MLENLRLTPDYDGFIFLAEAIRNPPVLRGHHHVELELNLVVSGTITYIAYGKRFKFGKRSLLWFFPAQEHQLVDRSPDAGYYVAVFKPSMLEQVCKTDRYKALKQQELSENGIIHCDLDPDVFEALQQQMQLLVKDGLDPDILNREAGFGISEGFRFRHHDPDYLNAGLRHLLLHSWRLQQERTSLSNQVSLHPAVRKVLEYLDGENEVQDLAFLAKSCHVSATYLSRIFAEEVGVSLSHYRNSLKLSRFWAAYRRSDKVTILEAALEAGFGSYAQFYRVFKRSYDENPRKALK